MDRRARGTGAAYIVRGLKFFFLRGRKCTGGTAGESEERTPARQARAATFLTGQA